MLKENKLEIKVLRNGRDYNKLVNDDLVELMCRDANDVLDLASAIYRNAKRKEKYRKTIFVINKEKKVHVLTMNYIRKYVEEQFNSHLNVKLPLMYVIVVKDSNNKVKYKIEDRHNITYSKTNGKIAAIIEKIQNKERMYIIDTNDTIEYLKAIDTKVFPAMMMSLKNIITKEEDRSFIEYAKYNGEYKVKCNPSDAEVIKEHTRIAKIKNGITYNLFGNPDNSIKYRNKLETEYGHRHIVEYTWLQYLFYFINTWNMSSPKIKEVLPESYKFDILEGMFDNYNIEDKYEKRALLKEIFKLTMNDESMFIDYLKFKHFKPELDFYMILLKFNDEKRERILNKLEEQDRLYDAEEGVFNIQLVDFDLCMDEEIDILD